MRVLRGHSNRGKQEGGAALITVLVAMLIITIMIFEFQYAAMVERQLAYNQLHQMQAYYLAKAGARVGLLRTSLYGRAQKSAQSIGQSFGGINIKPFLEMIWQLPVPAFPPARGSLGKMLKADKDAAEKVLKETQISDGQYIHTIANESSKININFLVLPASSLNDRPNFRPPVKSLAEQVGLMLITMIDNMMKASEDPYEEFPNLNPEELVLDIMDWVNQGQARLAGGSKDTFYESQNPPYKAKRNRFYTLDELKLVRGMTDHLFEKLRPYITVYSQDGKININSAPSEVMKAIYKDFSDDDIAKINEEKNKRGAWTTEKEFVDYVTTTLGRSGFNSAYPTAKDYPFTVASQGFLIESTGIIPKSGSQVTRTIKVGVALWSATAASGGQAMTQAQCTQMGAGFFYRSQVGLCSPAPKDENECRDAPGRWVPATTTCLVFDGNNPDGIPVKAPAPAAGGTAPPPNSLKVLFWTES